MSFDHILGMLTPRNTPHHGPNPFFRHENKHMGAKRVAQKLKFSNHGSKTKQCRDTKEPLEVLRQGQLTDHIRIKLHKFPKRMRTCGNLKSQWSYSGFNQSQIGRQGASDIFAIGTRQGLITSQGIPYTYVQSPTCPFDLNPYQGNTGGPVLSSIVAPKDDRIFLQNVNVKLTMTNSNTAATHVKIYILKPRGIHDKTPTAAWDQGYVDQALNQSLAVQKTGAIATVSGYPNRAMPFVQPQETKTFRNLYKVLKVNHYILDPQGTAYEQVTIDINSLLKKEEITAWTGDYCKHTIWFMMVTMGAEVDKAKDANASTYAPSDVRWCAQVRFNCKAIPENASRLAVSRITEDIIADDPLGAEHINIMDAVDTVTAI